MIEERKQEPIQVSESKPKVNLASSIREAAQRYEASKDVEIEDKREVKLESSPEVSSRAKSIAEKLGFMNFDEDEFDSPSYLRRDGREDNSENLI